ncbi:aspartate--ammonia ligase [Candidatus Woesearchaeota archaeon]|nr:aspartate--ammonia ligase [Candidatus Woesearchaeota archaeon]
MYKSILTLRETEKGIELIKNTFKEKLKQHLSLERVSAPPILEYGDGVNDDLAGTQTPVGFQVKHTENKIEIPQSLAKWKRLILGKYGFKHGEGVIADGNYLRSQEVVSDIHSIYVDQWDWERVMTKEERNLKFLEFIVGNIYQALRDTEEVVAREYPVLERMLSDKIHFIHTQDLEDKYPDLTPSERETKAAEEYGAYFLRGIGAKLKSGKPHDARAADYDDWITTAEDGKQGLNGDIIVYHPARKKSLELSSMGIRVDKKSLVEQCKEMGKEYKLEQDFQKRILGDSIPLSVGGGIGQSRICQLLLQKAHIGEVQASVWPESMRKECEAKGIYLL